MVTTNTLIKISTVTLLAGAISLATLAIIYVLQHPNLIATLATVSWNG